MFLMPKQGTLERLFIDAMIKSPTGVSYLDFVGTGITEQNIAQIARNVRTGMYESENDKFIPLDS